MYNKFKYLNSIMFYYFIPISDKNEKKDLLCACFIVSCVPTYTTTESGRIQNGQNIRLFIRLISKQYYYI